MKISGFAIGAALMLLCWSPCLAQREEHIIDPAFFEYDYFRLTLIKQLNQIRADHHRKKYSIRPHTAGGEYGSGYTGGGAQRDFERTNYAY